MPSVRIDRALLTLGQTQAARLGAAVFAVAVAAVALAGCAPVVLGGAAAGVSVIHDRRPANVMLEDQRIELLALERFHNNPDIAEGSRISATSYNRVVLLTGQARSATARHRYAELVSRLPNVRKVVDQVTIGPKAGLSQQSEDAYLGSRVKVALASVSVAGFDPTRVKVVTELGTIHLMGLLTHAEQEAVLAKARYVPGVIQVVNLLEPYQASDS